MSRNSVKFVKAALDENDKGEIILRGVIDPSSLKDLQIDDYQREVLPIARINELKDGFKTGSIPDIDLGMRGGNFMEIKKEGAFYLKDPVYIIDGLQRTTAALQIFQAGEAAHLGAQVHFNTTKEWERDRFRVLNIARTKLSPNILLRNLRSEYAAVETLYNMTYDKSFILNGRVSWDQRMQRCHVITALTFLKVSAALHHRMGTGLKGCRHDDLAKALQKTMNLIGRNKVRNNIRTFWDLIDESWGLKSIVFKEGAIYLRGSFLMVLSRILADFQTFWDDADLKIDRNLRRKIAQFPVNDAQVINLSSASGTAKKILYQIMLDHINSGKRTGRLVPFRKHVETESGIDVEIDDQIAAG